MSLSDIWTVAGILLGFQFTIVLGRIQREVAIEDKGYDMLNDRELEASVKDRVKKWSYWFTLADYMNLLAMTIIVLGVFIYPIVVAPKAQCVIDHVTAVTLKWFGLALVLFLGYIYALIGHYELFSSRKYRGSQTEIKRTPPQEWLTLIGVGVVAAIYIVMVFT